MVPYNRSLPFSDRKKTYDFWNFPSFSHFPSMYQPGIKKISFIADTEPKLWFLKSISGSIFFQISDRHKSYHIQWLNCTRAIQLLTFMTESQHLSSNIHKEYPNQLECPTKPVASAILCGLILPSILQRKTYLCQWEVKHTLQVLQVSWFLKSFWGFIPWSIYRALNQQGHWENSTETSQCQYDRRNTVAIEVTL